MAMASKELSLKAVSDLVSRTSEPKAHRRTSPTVLPSASRTGAVTTESAPVGASDLEDWGWTVPSARVFEELPPAAQVSS